MSFQLRHSRPLLKTESLYLHQARLRASMNIVKPIALMSSLLNLNGAPLRSIGLAPKSETNG